MSQFVTKFYIKSQGKLVRYKYSRGQLREYFFMKQEKYGFVYIWYDKRNKMFYIGSHWGTEDDGYICSSPKMLRAYARRPQDFKRRIIKRGFDNRPELLKEEDRWLKMIDPSKTLNNNKRLRDREENVRYYNINLSAWESWHADSELKKTVGQKISASKKGKSTGPCSEETKAKIGNANRGRKFTEEHCQKLREAKLGKTLSEDHKRKIGEAGIGRVGAWTGKKLSDEHKANIKRGMNKY